MKQLCHTNAKDVKYNNHNIKYTNMPEQIPTGYQQMV